MKILRFSIILSLIACVALAQTSIYRSVEAGATSAKATGTSNALSISGSTATFASALADEIGVGDAIQYDANGSSAITDVCFIHARTSSTSYTVKNAAGGTPTATSVNDNDWSLFRSYISLSNAEARTENTGISVIVRDFDTGTTRDLDTNNEKLFIACYNSADNTAVVINGWTTSTTDRVVIYTPTATSEVGTTQRHAGVYSTSAYRLEITSSGIGISIPSASPTEHIEFIGLQILINGTASTSAIFATDVTGEMIVSHSVIRGADGGTTGGAHHRGISWESGSTGTLKAYNNIIYDFITASTANDHAIRAAGTTAYAYNNTVYNCATGYARGGGTFVAKNDIAQACTDGFNGTFDAASDDNVSDLASDAPGANSDNSTTVTFVSTASDNFKLDSGDTGAKDKATDLSSDANLPFSNDILGTTRPVNSIWDRGAHEVSSGTRRVIFF